MITRRMFLLLPLILLFSAGAALAQSTAFTFQGKLGDSGTPVNGSFDMQFKLFDAADPNSSTQIGTTVTMNNPLVQVTNGVFTVQLDFGAAALPGADRFLEIGIRRNNTDPYTLLSPRSKVTSAPYAIRSLNATNANMANGLSTSCVGCIQSSQINTLDAGKLTGTIPASAISANSLPAGSANYIQNNTSSPQAANFNISGAALIGTRLGVGVTTPSYKLDVADFSGLALRVRSGITGGVLASFGDNGEFDIDAPAITGGRLKVLQNGNVGIGTPSPTQKLSVAGTIESRSGGVKFPDGTVQDGAVGPTYTIERNLILSLFKSPLSMLHLTLPNGTYLVESTLAISNNGFNFFDSEDVSCSFTGGLEYSMPIIGGRGAVLTLHSIVTVSSGGVDVFCHGPNLPGDFNDLVALERRMTAIRLGGTVYVQ